MKIGLGSDHAGFAYKQQIAAFLRERSLDVVDFGPDSDSPVDYPIFIFPVAEAVARGDLDRGVVIGGSGNGEAMAANRVKGVRCALCWNVESARLARLHNDANMVSIGQRLVDLPLVFQILTVWLETLFEGGRHARRIAMLDR